MRLALDATSLLGARTGVGTFTTEVLHRLALDPSVDVVAFGVTWQGRTTLADQVPAGVDVVDRPMAARPLRELWRRVDGPPIEWWTGPVDVVHGPNFVVPPARRAAEVVTVHDLTCVHFPQMCTRDTLQYPDLLRRAVRRGAFVHTVSSFVAQEVRDVLDVPADRVRAVPNGAPAPLGEATVAELAARGRALAGAARYVLALGTIEPRKDVPRLVRAFDELAAADTELVLVLAGPDGWGAEAVDLTVATSPHRSRIRRLGWVEPHGRDALLAGASVFAYPSVYEGFGLPPLEAMAHRTPVVAARAGALPEVVGPAAEWAEGGEVDDLAAALHRVLTDDARRTELVDLGLQRLGRYSWDRTAAGLVALYGDACA